MTTPKKICVVCNSKHRFRIEKEMLDHGGKETLRQMAALEPSFTQKAIKIHMAQHAGRVAEAAEPKDKKHKPDLEPGSNPTINTQLVAAQAQFDRVNAPLEELKAEAAGIRAVALEKNLLNTALLAIDKEARLIETQVKIAAEMRAQEMHNEIMQKREWARTQEYIWRFLDKHNLSDEFWEGLNALGTAQ